MKEDFKKYAEVIKKLWDDRRGRALIKFGIYILFVVFAVVTASATYNMNNDKKDVPVVKKETTIDNYKKLQSYSGSYIIGENTYDYSFSDKKIIKVDSRYYSIVNDILIDQLDNSVQAPVFDFKFWYLTPSFIYNLLKNGEELYKKEFKNKDLEISYIVPLSYFIQNYKGTILAIENTDEINNKNIEITTIEQDNKITNVKINLSTYYSLINNAVDNYNVEINYR